MLKQKLTFANDMDSNFKYKTKQRLKILELLKKTKEHLTAENIIEHFINIGEPIGKSTVYRCLDSLVEEDIVRKYISSERLGACFQYVDNNEECINHYHMKCTKCDKLFHLDCDEMIEFQSHIYNEHNFKIDFFKTILYGICNDCLSKE